MTTLPHSLAPSLSTAKVAIAYRNPAANRATSHIGLGVSALNTAKTLRAAGIWADVWPVDSAADIQRAIDNHERDAILRGRNPLTHLVISAPFIPAADMRSLVRNHPEIHFCVVCHSNVGFLAADTWAIELMRDGANLQASSHNFRIGGNSKKFTDWASHTWGRKLAHLPNLYYLGEMAHAYPRHAWSETGPLRIGCFGATRQLKNAITAAAAVAHLARTLKSDVEFWISTGREEGGKGIVGNLQSLLADAPHVKLVCDGWKDWAPFTQVVAQMHLLMQPSFTESFNMVTADGIAAGVASVVSHAIDWVPSDWIVNADDPAAMARKALHLLHDPFAAAEGQQALKHYVASGLEAWKWYLLHCDI